MDAYPKPVRFGIVVYDGVEPIDIGGTIGVISMARRVVPNLECLTIARQAGEVRLAGGLTILADTGFHDAPQCHVFLVCGGPGWRDQVSDAHMLAFLRGQPPGRIASVCTGALILAAAGILEGRIATTRRKSAGSEPQSPLRALQDIELRSTPVEAAIVEDGGVVTGGGVSLAIDTTLYLIGRFCGEKVRDEVAVLIEYDRAYDANRRSLGHRI